MPSWSSLSWVGIARASWAAAICLLLAACAASKTDEVADVPGAAVPTTAAVEISTPESGEGNLSAPIQAQPATPEEFRAFWQNSAHANTFVVDEAGANSSCARCHAPVNWMPSMEDMPESCYACKFEVKPPPPYVEENAWAHVDCKVCHREKKGEVQAEVVWLEIPPIEEYSAVQAPHEVCQRCHQAVEVPGHSGVQVGGAHVNIVCTQCHDSHSLKSGCDRSGCHTALEDAPPPIPGHDQDHASVSCVACHTGGEVTVGPDKAGSWITWEPEPQAGEATPAAFTSHNIILQAPCERCHFQDNPWQLTPSGELSLPAPGANP